jgi:hypothetical protein
MSLPIVALCEVGPPFQQDAPCCMPLQYSGGYATADHDQVDAGGRSIGEDRVTEWHVTE